MTISLTLHHIQKSFNLQTILKDVSFSVNAGERVGLIGPNGAGKSTLLHIITGQLQPDGGHIALSPATARLGYLSQGFDPDPTLSLNDLIHQEVGLPERLEEELMMLGVAFAESPEDESLQLRYDAVLQKLSRGDNGRFHATLSSLGLDHLAGDTPIGRLSGGQKTRLSLALLLLNQPELLLLDEPTNHLDIEMLEWLEAWLRDFSGGVLIVSHDRTFLDNTCSKIVDLDPKTQTVQEYVGNYSDYLEQYQLAREKQWSAYKDQVYEIRRMRQDIERTTNQARSVELTTKPNQPSVRRLAKKVAKKAKSREKKLDRYLASDERVEKPQRSWQMKLEVDGTAHLGKEVLRLDKLDVGYAGHPPLLCDIAANVGSGQRVVLTGANGSGKTTLLRTIAGRLSPLSGSVRLGHSVRLGYMSQEQELLDEEETAVSTIQAVSPMDHTETRNFLHFFLFEGDDPVRPIGQLSFGERARLSLARLVASGCNFLLLDEPINHLDIPSRERFEQALLQFEGTILAVIHDRTFIQRFATDIWWVEEGGIRQELR